MSAAVICYASEIIEYDRRKRGKDHTTLNEITTIQRKIQALKIRVRLRRTFSSFSRARRPVLSLASSSSARLWAAFATSCSWRYLTSCRSACRAAARFSPACISISRLWAAIATSRSCDASTCCCACSRCARSCSWFFYILEGNRR